MTDDTTTQRAEIQQRLDDLTRHEQFRWSVVRSPDGVPFYAVMQGRFSARVVAALDDAEAVAYLTARPTATENPLAPTNVLARVDGDAITCLKAVTSHAFTVRANRDLTSDAFERADQQLRLFVARIVAALPDSS